MKTNIKKIAVDWTEIKNECRHTDNKEDTDKAATTKFIKQLLISEHSPIRLGRIKWSWDGIKSWISVHFARHWLGWEKWVSTRRSDRTGIDRNGLRQDELVNMDVEANIQALINVSRFRLCKQASEETREYMMDLKAEIKERGQKEISDVMVPNCIYRMGCSEFKCCGHIYEFLNWAFEKGHNVSEMKDIQTRYDLYNEFFYSEVLKNE